jgi:protein kinase A
MKTLTKASVVAKRQVTHTLEEKRLLAAISYPFLIRLHEHFKDNSNLYLVMSYVNGGDLFGLINKLGRFPEDNAKFYAAQIVLAMEYLHHNNIVYRDLKPENVMVTSSGYLKLTDFGFAKRLDGSGRTWTLCGTPEYLAPELIQGLGYGLSVDWWTVGVLTYVSQNDMAAKY